MPEIYASPTGELPASDDSRLPLRRYMRILRDRWLVIAAAFLILTAAVAVGAAFTKPVFRATGSIEIRKQAAEVVAVDALFQFERISDQYLQTEYGTLRSKALLQRTFEDTALASRLQPLSSRTFREVDGKADQTAARLAEVLQKHLSVDPVVGSRIVRVSFDSPDPTVSADVVNALIEEYVTMRQEAGAAALVRLAEQSDSVRSHLVKGERELQQFVRENGLGVIVAAGNGGETLTGERLRRLQQELTEAETEGYRAAAIERSAAARNSAGLESELLKSLRMRRAELAGEYARARPMFTDSFPRVRQLRSEIAQLDSLIMLEQQRVANSMSNQSEAAQRRRDLLQGAVREQSTMMEAYAGTLAEYERRKRDLDSQTQLYTVLQQKRKEAALSAALARMDIAILDAAQPPRAPLRPRPKRDIPLAAVVGLLLGIGLAFLREYSDTTVKTPDEISGTVNTPLLGMIPSVPIPLPKRHFLALRGSTKTDGWHRIDAGGAQFPQLSEAFHGLRTSVLFDAGGMLPRTMLVTSSSPGEGKTTVSSNFAISLSMLGHRVLLVDCDLRRPSLHRVFGVSRRPGFVDYLAGNVLWHTTVHSVGGGLELLTAGSAALNPSDVLSSGNIQQWLIEASSTYDFVVLDAPALNINIADARILAHAVEGVLLVVRSGSTTRDVVRKLVAHTPNLIGIILNQLSLKRLPEYYSEYSGVARSHGNGRASGESDSWNDVEKQNGKYEFDGTVTIPVTEPREV